MPDPVDTAPAPSAPPGRPPRIWPDSVLAVLVVVFGFLAASFTARNSDLWLHLATGRLLSDGQYSFDRDPFGYTTADAYWANHAWLSDLCLYRAYTAGGGSGLVVLKAAIVALAVALMLAVARGPGPNWIAIGVTLVAVLAMSPRLLLQPACASITLLALTLWLFRRGGRAHAALPLVIALWANLDEWYVLGLLLIGLCWVGHRLSPSADAPRPPAWLVPACLGACLLTPFHARGLTLPTELSPAVWNSQFANDPRFAGMFLSPWHIESLGASAGYNLAAWAFWALLGLGLVSFAANRSAVHGWRGLTWLGFAALACWQVNLVPFFAVVAGPITALNLREAVPEGFVRRPGRILVGLGAVVLIALTWPGWLQGFATRDRGLAWAAAPDPSLAHAAKVVRQWRADGRLPSGIRTLASHPDLAHHLVWFCPGERVFVDSRLGLFAPIAPQYESVSRSLGLLVGPDPGADQTLREHSVGCVLLYDPDPRRLTGGLRQVATNGRWDLLAVEGAVAFLRPRDAATSVPGRSFAPDLGAFGPPAEDGLVPAGGVALVVEPDPVWARRNRPRRTAWQGDAAFVYLRLFEIEGAAAPATTTGKPVDWSPALPILAARAARTAVAASPADDGAWLHLARAYLFQSRIGWEVEFGRGFPLLVHLRQVQVAAALFQAVVANPDSAGGHEALARLYGERRFLDLAVRHQRTLAQLTRRAGPAAGESDDGFTERLNRLTRVLEEAENALQDAENRFLVQSFGLAGDPLRRARIATRLGLPARAIETLTTSHADLYGPEGLRLLLELLVWTGQAADARALLDRDEIRKNPDVLGTHDVPGGLQDGRPWGYQLHAHDWFECCVSAAAGKYPAATGALGRLQARLEGFESGARGPTTRAGIHKLVAQVGLAAGPGAGWAMPYTSWDRQGVADFYGQLDMAASQRADLYTLEGLLHLERGATDEADRQFAEAARLYRTQTATALVRPGQPLTERYRAAVRSAAGAKP